MGKYGLEIKNIQAAPLYGYNLGVRDSYDWTPAMFNKSLFYYYLTSHGLKTYKDESTRDIICIDFSFGTRSYEEEVAHLQKMRNDAANDAEAVMRITNLIAKAEKNKFKYDKKSKDELRYLFYKEGVSVEYKRIDRKTKEVITEKIHYRMLYRNPSKAKQGLCMFINEKLYKKAHKWLTLGLDKYMPKDDALIVELSAYSSLVASSVEGTFHIDIDDVLILKDQDSFFKTVADIVKSSDYEGTERVIDSEKTERNRQRAIKNETLDIYGNPIYKISYKKIPVTKKKCIVSREETDVKNTLWDGMALMDDSVFPEYCNGMALLRNHFFKACAFRSYIQKFLQDYCLEHGIDYDTYEIEDMFGQKHLAKNIKVITTDNAWKLKKFARYLGGINEAYEYWKGKVRKDACIFGCVKTDHPSKFGEVQRLSYQMINTLPSTMEDINKIAQTSINYVESLKNNDEEYVKYLRRNANVINHYDMMADLYEYNPDIAKTEFYRSSKTRVISQYVYKLRGGKITVSGDNLTVCGNPYALLLYTVGEDWEKDPTLQQQDGVIQVYTNRFKDGEFLCGIRSPHNSCNNLGYFVNSKHPLMEKYFNFSDNIIAVNCIHTDIQARMNGEDFDSDFNFVTNQPEMVKAAKIAYENYPTVVNAIEDSGLSYRNIPEEYAKMDSSMAAAQKAIGGSSDSAQLAQSYYWTKVARNEYDDETQELYENVVILAVLAQIAIDGCKKTFAVDANSEIERIRSMNCMNKVHVEISENGKKIKTRKDFPEFWTYCHDIPVTKNGKERKNEDVRKDRSKMKSRVDKGYICPMNWLQKSLDKIQGMRRLPSSEMIDILELYVPIRGKAHNRQMGKIRQLIEEYDYFVRNNFTQINEDDDMFVVFLERTDILTEKIRSYNISSYTMNRLIGTVLGYVDKVNNEKRYKLASKYILRTLNILYNVDKDKFLSNFTPKKAEHPIS